MQRPHRGVSSRGRAIELIDRCKQGDALAWRELVGRHRPAILRVLARASGTTNLAELADLEQDVWTRILRRDLEALRGLRGREDSVVRAFLCTVALNVARDARRRAGARPEATASGPTDLDSLQDDPDVDPEERAADRERHRQVLDAARAEVRDERDLMIFQLYYRDGASASEIAAVPGVGLTTKGVETVIHRITGRVRRRFTTDA